MLYNMMGENVQFENKWPVQEFVFSLYGKGSTNKGWESKLDIQVALGLVCLKIFDRLIGSQASRKTYFVVVKVFDVWNFLLLKISSAVMHSSCVVLLQLVWLSWVLKCIDRYMHLMKTFDWKLKSNIRTVWFSTEQFEDCIYYTFEYSIKIRSYFYQSVKIISSKDPQIPISSYVFSTSSYITTKISWKRKHSPLCTWHIIPMYIS